MKMKNWEKGFSLVELLVVVIVIAIVAAIAIPNLLASRRAANDASAINSLRTIGSANVAYYARTTPNHYGDLIILEGVNLLDPTFANIPVTKSGFIIVASVPLSATPQSFCASAVPITPGSTGNKGYAISERGVIYRYDTAGDAAIACSLGVLTPGAGVPL